MSTYEARKANTTRHDSLSHRLADISISRESVETALQRGRRERSLALWSMLQAVFGRPEGRDQDDRAELSAPADRCAPLAR